MPEKRRGAIERLLIEHARLDKTRARLASLHLKAQLLHLKAQFRNGSVTASSSVTGRRPE